MAVDLGRLVSEVKRHVQLDELRGKTIAIDAYNTIYQFLSIIRQPDGMPLIDSKKRVTSHLSGLFYRTINLIENGITPIFIFDGAPPALKKRTLEARMSRRAEAEEQWKEAVEKGMLEEARTYAMASTRITKEIVESSKELLRRMGIAYIQAPGEGEAQAASMTRKGLVYASASQDYDLFLFGSDTVVRNLTITGRRKLPRKNVYINIETERIYLNDLLEGLRIGQRQLILLGMLTGTDFNTGIGGVGPMTALKIVREKKSPEEILAYVNEKYGTGFDEDIYEVLRIFEQPDIKDLSFEDISRLLKECRPERHAIIEFMCGEHGFSEDRISKFADKLASQRQSKSQRSMDQWMGR